MVELKRFENADNKMVCVFLRKGIDSWYPVPYIVWEKTQRLKPRQDMTLAQVQAITRQLNWVASPIYPNGGPWLTMERALLPAVQRMIGKSNYHARKGITSDLNGVYWIEVLSRRADGNLLFRNLNAIGKHSVAPFESIIEPGLVFPLVRVRDAKPFYTEDSHIYVIVPHDGWSEYLETLMLHAYRHALHYFRMNNPQLDPRSS